MIVKMQDEDTLIVRPETPAEMEYLKKFVGATVGVETPKPFESNVRSLLIKKK